MATALAAFNSARTSLNDVNATMWTDAVLLPYLVEAYHDLLLILWVNGLPVIKEKSAAITVAAATAPTLTLPSDLVEPIDLKERASGSSEQWIPMTETEWEPDVITLSETLRYWNWREQEIKFVGSTTARQVLLRYYKSLTDPTSNASALGFIFAEYFLGPQTAGYAAGSVGNISLAQELIYIKDKNQGIAGARLDMIIRANIKGMQNLPARRIPYRRFARSRLLF